MADASVDMAAQLPPVSWAHELETDAQDGTLLPVLMQDANMCLVNKCDASDPARCYNLADNTKGLWDYRVGKERSGGAARTHDTLPGSEAEHAIFQYMPTTGAGGSCLNSGMVNDRAGVASAGWVTPYAPSDGEHCAVAPRRPSHLRRHVRLRRDVPANAALRERVCGGREVALGDSYTPGKGQIVLDYAMDFDGKGLDVCETGGAGAKPLPASSEMRTALEGDPPTGPPKSPEERCEERCAAQPAYPVPFLTVPGDECICHEETPSADRPAPSAQPAKIPKMATEAARAAANRVEAMATTMATTAATTAAARAATEAVTTGVATEAATAKAAARAAARVD